MDFFENVDKELDIWSYYDKVLLTGDFNAKIYEHYLENFIYQYKLKSLVKEKKTCFKSILNPSYIDFFNKQRTFFQSTETINTGLFSNFKNQHC